MTLRRRLATALAVAVGVPLVVLAVLAVALAPRLTGDLMEARLTETARATGVALGLTCANAGSAARALAAEASHVLDEGAPDEHLQAAMADAVGAREGAGAAVIGPTGAPLTSLGAEIAVEAGEASCSRGRLVVGGRSVIAEAVPVTAADDDAPLATAVVAYPLDEAWVTGLLETLEPPDSTRAVLVAEGVVLASSAGEETMQAALNAVEDEEDSGRLRVPGRDRLYAQAPPIAGMGVVVAATAPAPPVALLTAIGVALLLTALALGVYATALLAGRLVDPVQELAVAAERVGRGEAGVRVPVRGDDEVGRLSAAFNAMAADVDAALAEARAGRDAHADTLRRFGEALGRTHDLDGLLRTLLDLSLRVSAGTAGFVHLGSRTPERPRASVLPPDLPCGADVEKAALRLAARAISSGEVSENRSLPGDATGLAVPLRNGDEVVGAVTVVVPAAAGTIDERARQALHDLVEPAGTAVRNVLMHREAQRLSVTDPLTGAGNFRNLSTTLAREVERANRFNRPLSVLMVDLDHFKAVNDTHGHARGDAVLREVARRLQLAVREVDTVARYGGEEFALVLPETDVEGAQLVAARVVDAVRSESVRAEGETVHVTVSVGVASFPLHGRSAGDVLRRADEALYQAKHGGRDRYEVFSAPVPAHGAEEAGRG